MRYWRRVITGSLREIIFGLEDGLVSTLGVVTGIASGTANQRIVILSGFILVIVEALSMAAGTYLSNKAEADQERLRRHRNHHASPALGGLVMGVAYIAGGAVPLSPYLFTTLSLGLQISIVLTVVTLFMIGIFKGVITKTPAVRSGFEMAVVSISAAMVGYLIGELGSRILMIPRWLP